MRVKAKSIIIIFKTFHFQIRNHHSISSKMRFTFFTTVSLAAIQAHSAKANKVDEYTDLQLLAQLKSAADEENWLLQNDD